MSGNEYVEQNGSMALRPCRGLSLLGAKIMSSVHGRGDPPWLIPGTRVSCTLGGKVIPATQIAVPRTYHIDEKDKIGAYKERAGASKAGLKQIGKMKMRLAAIP